MDTNPTSVGIVAYPSEQVLLDRIESKRKERDRKNAAHVRAACDLATVEFEIEELEAEVARAR